MKEFKTNLIGLGLMILCIGLSAIPGLANIFMFPAIIGVFMFASFPLYCNSVIGTMLLKSTLVFTPVAIVFALIILSIYALSSIPIFTLINRIKNSFSMQPIAVSELRLRKKPPSIWRMMKPSNLIFLLINPWLRFMPIKSRLSAEEYTRATPKRRLE